MSVPSAAGYPGFTSAQGLIPQLFAKEFNIYYWANTVLPRITTGKFYEGLLSQGDQVTVANTPVISTKPYTKGQELDVNIPQQSPVVLTVNRGRYFNIPLDDVDEKQSHLDVAGKYVEVGNKQMARDIETEFFTAMPGQAHAKNRGLTAGVQSGQYNLGTTAAPITISNTGTSGSVSAIDLLTRIRSVLAEQNAFEAGKVGIVVPVWFRYLIMNSILRQAYLTGDDKSILRSGLIGSVDGMELYESTLLPQTSSYTQFYAFNRDAVSYIAQLNKEEKIRSTTTFATLFRGLMVYDWGIRKPEGMVEITAANGGVTATTTCVGGVVIGGDGQSVAPE